MRLFRTVDNQYVFKVSWYTGVKEVYSVLARNKDEALKKVTNSFIHTKPEFEFLGEVVGEIQ